MWICSGCDSGEQLRLGKDLRWGTRWDVEGSRKEHLLRTILGCLLPLVACQLTRLFNAFLRFCSKVGFRLLSTGLARGWAGQLGQAGGGRTHLRITKRCFYMLNGKSNLWPMAFCSLRFPSSPASSSCDHVVVHRFRRHFCFRFVFVLFAARSCSPGGRPTGRGWGQTSSASLF